MSSELTSIPNKNKPLACVVCPRIIRKVGEDTGLYPHIWVVETKIHCIGSPLP